jgi:hypothetical protein
MPAPATTLPVRPRLRVVDATEIARWQRDRQKARTHQSAKSGLRVTIGERTGMGSDDEADYLVTRNGASGRGR